MCSVLAPRDDASDGATLEPGSGAGATCCTSKMEAALAARSRQGFDQSLQNALDGKLAAVLRARATKFDGEA